MGDFGAINTAVTALNAYRQALDTAGHNIANANTPGYTRQRVDLASVGGSTVPAFFAKSSAAGAGVNVVGVERMTDRFMTLRSLQEHSAQASLDQTKTILSRAELALSEPGDQGLQAQMSDVWAAWDDVANNPDDVPTRTALLEKAQTVVGSFNKISTDLKALATSSANEGVDQVNELNTLAGQVAQLNDAIENATNGRMQPNDLLDQRDQVIAKMSELAGVTVRENSNGMTDVYVGGSALVSGRYTMQMSASTTNGLAITWSDGTAVRLGGGSLAALSTAVNQTIPNYLHGPGGLDAVAQQFADTINNGQAQGADLNSATTPGIAMFTIGDPADVAGTLGMNPAMTPDKVAAAKLQAPPGTLSVWDGSNALALAEAGKPVLSTYGSFVDTLGVDVQRANRQSAIQQSITDQVDATKSSAQGVSIDEEMTNMMAAQHAYEAAARFLTAVDSTIDTLIHGTGLVGR